MKSDSLSKRNSQVRILSAFATLVAALLFTTLKFWAFHRTGSMAIYSDMLESFVNIVTASVGIAVIGFASQPVDEDHPYGHGKIEYVSAAFEGGLISFAGILAITDAVQAQFHHSAIKNLSSGLWIIGACAALTLIAGLLLKVVGKTYSSPVLEASGVHLLADFSTTIGAMVSIALVKWTGIAWLDRVIAIIIGLMMLYAGARLVRQSASGLLDAEDKKLLERLAEVFEKFSGDGIIQIHHARIIRAGWFHHIDAHVVVPEFWSINQAHARLNQFEAAVFGTYEYEGEANFHLDPCQRKYCSVCDYPECPVRRENFVRRLPVVLEHLRSKDEPV